MSLKNIILIGVLSFMILATVINGWFMTRLANNVSEKLGEASFDVSKSTVESLLPQKLYSGTLVLRSEQHLTTQDTQVRRFQFRSPQIRLENEVNLELKDREESRAILLTFGKQTFDIPIPRTELEKIVHSVRNAIFVSSGIIIVLSVLFFYWFAKRITQPIQSISQTSQKIGEGNFGVTVPKGQRFSGTELTQLVNSVNKMSNHLLQLETEKRKLQEQKSTSEISDIARGLAHSIRNPLHTILLALGTLTDDAPQHETLKQTIKHQVDRIDRHIKNLMTITTHNSLKNESVNLKQLIARIIREVETNCSDCKLTFHAETDAIIQGVEAELYTTLSSIINNAVESYETNNKGRVDVILAVKDTQVIVTVTDSGCGINARNQEDLFKPHNTSKSYGAGMGLYIANKLVKGRYNGEIQFQKNKPQGSIFKVTLSDREALS